MERVVHLCVQLYKMIHPKSQAPKKALLYKNKPPRGKSYPGKSVPDYLESDDSESDIGSDSGLGKELFGNSRKICASYYSHERFHLQVEKFMGTGLKLDVQARADWRKYASPRYTDFLSLALQEHRPMFDTQPLERVVEFRDILEDVLQHIRPFYGDSISSMDYAVLHQGLAPNSRENGCNTFTRMMKMHVDTFYPVIHFVITGRETLLRIARRSIKGKIRIEDPMRLTEGDFVICRGNHHLQYYEPRFYSKSLKDGSLHSPAVTIATFFKYK